MTDLVFESECEQFIELIDSDRYADGFVSKRSSSISYASPVITSALRSRSQLFSNNCVRGEEGKGNAG